jgi:hypothetical protein
MYSMTASGDADAGDVVAHPIIFPRQTALKIVFANGTDSALL